MAQDRAPTDFDTHVVFNQSPPFGDLNLFTTDTALQEAVSREAGDGATYELTHFGAIAGSREMLEHGRRANETLPRLDSFTDKGERRDTVEFHPSYHKLMETSIAQGLHCGSFEHFATNSRPCSGANVVRAAGSYMAAQMEAGHCCPITMTNAACATIAQEPAIANVWLPRILQRLYDPSFRPAHQKQAVTIGMGMTEKQGGTDVRANTTQALPVGRAGPTEDYLITGHKWFMSAPMCDAFLILAQAPGGLSCFLVPRWRPDGTVNPLRFQRLKLKLGNRSNASSEVEFNGVLGWMIGEEGRGVQTIIEMVTYTRLDCAVSSAGLMRFCFANALHHCRHRQAFGKPLAEQPLMASVLADLAVESEAATALAFRLARAFDRPDDPREGAFRRLMTPVVKYWNCKVAPAFSFEAMECLGGNGYVEEGLLARAYRETPVNAIWEGSGNVMCLDVLRVLQKEPGTAEVVFDGLRESVGADRRLGQLIAAVEDILHRPRELELRARALVEGLAVATAAVLLTAHGSGPVADHFVRSRLDGRRGMTYGSSNTRADVRAILDRAGW